MSENHQLGVSPDKLSRPEQADLGAQAGVRALIIGNAVARAAQALTPMLTNIIAAEALKYPVEPAQQPAYQPEYQQPQTAEPDKPWATPATSGAGYSAAAELDAYLDAITSESSDVEPSTGTNWQETSLTDEQAQRLADARQDLAGLHDEAQDNYRLAA